jgi:hypothetical protein
MARGARPEEEYFMRRSRLASKPACLQQSKVNRPGSISFHFLFFKKIIIIIIIPFYFRWER